MTQSSSPNCLPTENRVRDTTTRRASCQPRTLTDQARTAWNDRCMEAGPGVFVCGNDPTANLLNMYIRCETNPMTGQTEATGEPRGCGAGTCQDFVFNENAAQLCTR